MNPIPSFADFYVAVHGHPPFPWQQRLAELARNGSWPTEVGVPTGLGKTACLDIAVWALAAQADRAPIDRLAPTRIWWLVNRRLLVDATADHASRLAAALEDPQQGPSNASSQQVLADVADRLRSLSPEGRKPLEVVRLRGGAASARPSSPAQPAIILSTIPMYGSRLLFRGFGASNSMWPIDAALAGTDSLLLIDEAHLAQNLVGLFQPLNDCDTIRVPVISSGRVRPMPVTLTATGSAPQHQRFDLDVDDLANPVIVQRLAAAKPTRIAVPPVGVKVAERLATEAVSLLDTPEPTSVVVFANTPRMAREVFADIRKRVAVDAVHLELLTGRVREREGASIRSRILDPDVGAPSSRATVTRNRHLVVVATQTLEVGADLDFEQLVTECCGTRALTQRLGRLNRLGRYANSRAVYVHVEPKSKVGGDASWPVYGTEPARVIERLLSAAIDGVVDLSVGTVRSVLGEPLDDVHFAPQVLPALLWEWAKTSLPPDGEAPVEQYFSGLQQRDLRASVCWRAYETPDGDHLWPRVRETETVDVPIYELAEAFEGRSIRRLQRDRLTIETVDAESIRPGDLIVLRCEDGLYDLHGWAPDAVEGKVADVAVLSRGLPLDAHALSVIAGPGPWDAFTVPLIDPADDADAGNLADAVRDLISVLRARQPIAYSPEEWALLLDSLSSEVRRVPGEVARLEVIAGVEEPRADDLDELSLAARVNLDLHGDGVGRYAARIAERIGLAAELVAAVAMAGEFHDIGKADRRFQSWLDPFGRADSPIAKSDRPRARWIGDRIAAGWPNGGRHEVLSARLALDWFEGSNIPASDLIVHLIASHHGHSRPVTLPVAGGALSEVEATVRGRAIRVSADLGVSDWEQPRRFRILCETYGFWGVALLEACVRQADHAVSAGNVDWAVL